MTHTSGSLGRRLTFLTTTALLTATWTNAPAAASSAPDAAVPLSPCVSADNGSPTLTALRLDHKTLDTRHHPSTLRVTVEADDTGGPGDAVGVTGGGIALETDEAEWVSRPLHRTDTGAWVASFRFPRHLGDESWFISGWLEDGAGNSSGFDDRDLHDLGLPHVVRIRSGSSKRLRLADLRFDRGPIDTRDHPVRVHVRARMASSRPVRRLRLRAGDGKGHGSAAVLRPVPGHPRILKGHWLVPRFQTNGTWRVRAGLLVTSIPYFEYSVGPSFLREAGGPLTFRVRSGPDDSRPPSVGGDAQTPADVDVTASDQSIMSTVEVRDSRSGVARVTVTHHLQGDSYAFRTEAHLHLTAGTARDGTWTGAALLTPCGSTAGRWVTDVQVWDASGNRTHLGPSALQARGWPSETQVTGADHFLDRVFASTDDEATVDVTFAEPVTGIDSASAYVFLAPYQINDFYWSDPGPPVAGTWVCQDAGGAETDCATGAVTTATYTVTAGGSWDTLGLNPDHSLSVRDLAGNPFDHAWIGIRDNTFRNRSGHARTLYPGDCSTLLRRLGEGEVEGSRSSIAQCRAVTGRG